MLRLHPYEYSYCNQFIGGLHGAYLKGVVTEYWATSYKEGVEKLESFLRARDGNQFGNSTYSILVGPAEWCPSYYFPMNFPLAKDRTEAEYYISTTRDRADARYAGWDIFAVGRFRTSFVIGKILTRQESNATNIK